MSIILIHYIHSKYFEPQNTPLYTPKTKAAQNAASNRPVSTAIYQIIAYKKNQSLCVIIIKCNKCNSKTNKYLRIPKPITSVLVFAKTENSHQIPFKRE